MLEPDPAVEVPRRPREWERLALLEAGKKLGVGWGVAGSSSGVGRGCGGWCGLNVRTGRLRYGGAGRWVVRLNWRMDTIGGWEGGSWWWWRCMPKRLWYNESNVVWIVLRRKGMWRWGGCGLWQWSGCG